MGQLGFYDLDKRLKALSAKGDPLEALNALVPFESFRAEIEAVVRLAPEAKPGPAALTDGVRRIHELLKSVQP